MSVVYVLLYCFAVQFCLLWFFQKLSFRRRKSLVSLFEIVYQWRMIFSPRKGHFITFTIECAKTIELTKGIFFLWCHLTCLLIHDSNGVKFPESFELIIWTLNSCHCKHCSRLFAFFRSRNRTTYKPAQFRLCCHGGSRAPLSNCPLHQLVVLISSNQQVYSNRFPWESVSKLDVFQERAFF